jgi:hypothetical protein
MESPKSKQPVQLIQEILKGFDRNGSAYTVSPYYSEESEEKLAEILTNPGRLQTFISLLEREMSDADESVVRNYEMLIILLNHLSKSDFEVRHSAKGM